MPQRHEYQCLNQRCPSATNVYRAKKFTAMNDEAVCPQCGSIKLHDFGESGPVPEAPYVIGADSRAHSKNSDANLKRVAERYGMTNMSNKDGRGVKAQPAAASFSGPTTKIGGIDVPVEAGISGACINVPQMAQSLSATWTGPGKTPNMLKSMTNVVGKHDG